MRLEKKGYDPTGASGGRGQNVSWGRKTGRKVTGFRPTRTPTSRGFDEIGLKIRHPPPMRGDIVRSLSYGWLIETPPDGHVTSR